MSEAEKKSIQEIIDGLDPADWVQIKLLAKMPSERRVIPALRAKAMAMGTFRITLEKRYPELSRQEINMKLLRHFTTVRMPE